MRELIRHILKESRLQQELKQVIEDNGIFDAIDMVGGIKNFKKVFKNDPEASQILDGLTGVVDFEYHDAFKDPRFFVFPIEYEIIGIEKNTWGTHSWPLLNLIYDESKLTSAEKKKLITILATIQNDNTVGKIETNLPEIKSSGYFDVRQINGKNTDIHDVEFPFSKEDVKKIHNKLYGESESLNESDNHETDKNLRAINVLLSLVNWDGLCDIWAEYNPDDKEYEIRSKTTVRHFYSDEILKELESLEDSIKSMGIKVYIFAPWYVDSCEDEVKFMNESSNRSEKDTKKLFRITKMIMEDLILPEYNHLICSYEITLNEVFNIPEVTVLFIGGYGTKLWPMTQGIRQMYLNVLEDISKEFRNKIEEQGLKVRAGECYKIYVGYGEKCIPAIFATNSSNKRAWFDSTYDDDVWEIDTTKIPNVKWFKDRHFDSRSKHIVTFENIPRDAIKLIYEGSGKDSGLMESESKSEDKKLNLVKEMIYSLFDEVEFIEVDTNYQGKPLIKVYHDVEDTAANYDNWFTHRIIDEIKEMTGDGVVLAPWWALGWDWKYKNPDIFIGVEKIDYDDEGNVINESEEKQPKYLNIIKDLVEPFKDEVGVCDINVSYDDDDDMYSVYIVMSTEEMNDKFSYVPMIQSHISKLRINVRTTIKDYLPIDNLYVGSYGKPNCNWNPLNESSIKEKSLVKLIEKDGLYNFIEMSGLDFNQVRSLIKQIDNPKEILKQYIREFVLEHDGTSNGDYGSLFALRLPLSNTKYVNDIMVQDRDQIAVEIWGYEEDEYGHTEQTEQYLTSINTLTTEELLSILSWMMETIEGGYWD